MRSLVFALFVLFFSSFAFAQQSTFQGKVDFTKRIRDFPTQTPAAGTLYLFTGSAGVVTIDGDEPFVASVEMIEGEWKSESSLVSSSVVLKFEGNGWSELVLAKKPRTSSAATIYPFRRFFAAVVYLGTQAFNGRQLPAFRVLHAQPIE